MKKLSIPLTCLAVLLLAGGFQPTGFAQDPSGRPTESPKNRKPVRRPPAARPDSGPITVILTVLTDPPESTVYINGEERGVTNAEGRIQFEKLPLGHYSVEVRKQGYTNMLRGFNAGSESPTLVFKLEANLEDAVKEFDSLVASGKLTGPDSPNASEVVERLSSKFPDRPETSRVRGVLAAKLEESIAPVINNTVLNWRSVSREEIERADGAATGALALKKDDPRIRAAAAYLRGALALRDWQTGGGKAAAPEQAPTDGGQAARETLLAAARKEFEAALELDASMTAAQYQLGVALLASGEASAAEAAFVKVAQREPRWSAGHIGLGSAYHAQKKYKEAIEAFRKAIEIEPKQAAALAGLGLARAAKGEKDGTKDIERAMQLDPTSPVPHLNLGIALSQSKNKKDATRAVEELQKAIQMNPQNLDFQNRVAEQLIADIQKRKK